MFYTKHFVTGTFASHASFVDDATYSKILDNVVKATCDIFLTRRRAPTKPVEEHATTTDCRSAVTVADADDDVEILMGERVGLPHADWWIPGGRMMPGETCAAAAQRILARELKLDIGASQDRVRTLAHYTFVWDTRTQEPVHNGTCDVSIILRVDLTDAEAAGIELLSKEYKQLEWRTLASQSALPAGALHPALAQGVRDLCAMRQWERLMQALKSSDAAGGEEPESLRRVVDHLRRYAELKGEWAAPSTVESVGSATSLS